MIAKLFVVFSVLAISNAFPTFIGRAFGIPGLAVGFNNRLNNIGGISQSSGASNLSSHNGVNKPHSASFASAGNNAHKVGHTHAVPHHSNQPQGLQQSAASAFSKSFGRNHGAAFSAAQNFGNSGLSLSSAQSHDGFGVAISAVQNNGLRNLQSAASQAYNGRNGFDSAVSSASSNGLGFGVAQSAAQNFGGHGSAISFSQNRGLNNLGAAISAANNNGGFGSSFAQSAQQNGRYQQHSDAISINVPGIQASQSRAFNGFY